MKNIIKAVIAIAIVSTPLFALEPTLETQKHDSSLMMDGMKSLNSSVSATWVSKEQAEAVTKEAATSLKDAKTEIAPAVAREKAELAAAKIVIKADVPNLPAEQPAKSSHTALKVAGGVIGGIVIGVGLVFAAAIHFLITHPIIM